jgi:hypothetical protein
VTVALFDGAAGRDDPVDNLIDFDGSPGEVAERFKALAC